MFFCCICGAVTGASFSDEQDSVGWLSRVRAIYITKLNYLEPKISGTGYVGGMADPVSVLEVLDTSEHSQDISPGVLNIHFPFPIVYPDGTFHPQSSPSGFVFHRNCYQLLEWALYPTKIQIGTLNLFLRSFGVLPDRHVVNWGHTFAGLYSSHDANNRTLHHQIDNFPPLSGSWAVNPLLTENEAVLKQLRDLMLKSRCTGRESISSCVQPDIRQACLEITDVFGGLPAELLEYIMILLESRDVLNLRLASRNFLAIPLSKAFWRSRFATGHEFESIIEPWLYKDEIIKDTHFAEPQLVYEVMKDISGSRMIANRRRIWGIIKPLVTALTAFASHEETYSSIEPCGKPLATLWHPDLDDEDPTTRWSCGHGELLDSELHPYHFGCRPLFKRLVTLPAQVESVKVSVLPFHNTTYITGLRFCSSQSFETTIGYILREREVTLPTGGILRGFKVTVGERGVHGLSVVDRSRHHSSTAGLAAGLQEKTLGMGNRVEAVKAYFDGMKMVFIAVPDYVSKPVGPYSIWKQARDFVELSNLPNQ